MMVALVAVKHSRRIHESSPKKGWEAVGVWSNNQGLPNPRNASRRWLPAVSGFGSGASRLTIDLDLTGLRGLRLGQRQREDPQIVISLSLLRVDGSGQGH